MKKVGIKVARALLFFIYLWVTIVLVLLALRFFLELFGANPTSGFVDWVYRSTQRAMAPFRGIFEPVVVSDQSTLDISVLFAMIVYGFVALALHALVEWLTRRLQVTEAQEYHQEVLAAQTAATAPARVLQLNGPTGVAATVVLTPATYGTTVEISAVGLSPARPYTAWIEGADGVRVTTSPFNTDAAGMAQLTLAAPVLLSTGRRFGLTALPSADDATSTDVLASVIV